MRGLGVLLTLGSWGCYATTDCNLSREIEPSLTLGEGESVMEEPDNGIAAILTGSDGERYIWGAMRAAGIVADPPPSARIQLFDAVDGREVGLGLEDSRSWRGDESQSTVTGISVLIEEDWLGDVVETRMLGEVTDSCGTTLTAERSIYLNWSF